MVHDINCTHTGNYVWYYKYSNLHMTLILIQKFYTVKTKAFGQHCWNSLKLIGIILDRFCRTIKRGWMVLYFWISPSNSLVFSHFITLKTINDRIKCQNTREYFYESYQGKSEEAWLKQLSTFLRMNLYTKCLLRIVTLRM